MAWTAPSTWANSTVVTDTMLNQQLRDNLRYLKGLDGAISIENDVAIGTSSAPSYRMHVVKSDSTSTRTGAIGAEVAIENSSTGGTRHAGVRLRAVDTASTIYSVARIVAGFPVGSFSDAAMYLQTTNGVETFRDVMTLRGPNVGIGTTAPSTLLHIANGTDGGAAQWSSASINGTLQTILAASSVGNCIVLHGILRNSAGSNAAVTGLTMSLGGGQAVAVGADTVTITLTAGGGLTIQRTAGINLCRGSLWVVWT